MKTSNDWLKEIEELYFGQKGGVIKPAKAMEMNNTLGKLIGLTKLQLDYQRLQSEMGGNPPSMPMLESHAQQQKKQRRADEIAEHLRRARELEAEILREEAQED